MDVNESSSVTHMSGECDQDEDYAALMHKHLPPGEKYEIRKNARHALQRASILATSHGVRGDDKVSGSNYVTFRCGGAFGPTNPDSRAESCYFSDQKHEAQLLGDEFSCERKDGESIPAFKRRRLQAKIDYLVLKGYCGFQAALKCVKCGETSQWEFQRMGNGLNYIPHCDTCMHVGKLKEKGLEDEMKKALPGDKAISRKEVTASMIGKSSIAVINLPAKSTMYRAQSNLKNESVKWYDKNYERLEVYLNEFREKNPGCRVTLVKDNENLQILSNIAKSQRSYKNFNSIAKFEI